MDPEKFDELKKDTEGEFGGLGVIVEVSKEKILTVISPMEDSLRLKAGTSPARPDTQDQRCEHDSSGF